MYLHKLLRIKKRELKKKETKDLLGGNIEGTIKLFSLFLNIFSGEQLKSYCFRFLNIIPTDFYLVCYKKILKFICIKA